VVVTACGERTKEDIIQKARNVSTRSELEQTLGKPTDIAKLAAGAVDLQGQERRGRLPHRR
jgi:hypothetical protein